MLLYRTYVNIRRKVGITWEEVEEAVAVLAAAEDISTTEEAEVVEAVAIGQVLRAVTTTPTVDTEEAAQMFT